MGLFDFFKGEFIEVIDWVEQDKDTVMWKFPDKDANIKYGAQLTVRESQTALFLDEGQFGDVYEPGRHKLITDNMPIMTTLKSWKHGFDSPFKADVYFLSTRTFMGLKWGTPNPIILRDPEFKQVRVKAFGTYFIKIKDPKKFFTEFGGTSSVLKVHEIEDRLRDIVSPKFAESIGEAGVSVLDMVSNYSELGDKIAPLLQADLDPFGIELTKFQITSTSLPKEVEAFYDKMTNMNMVDNMNKFQQFQQANAIEKAAENPGGGASEGIGLGVGMGMANQMMQQQQMQQQQMQQQNQQVQQQQPVAETRESIFSALKELGALKEAGILTEAEFDGKKKELLAKL
ncbi:MAG: SPFH domain-containing protein [Saprospiraceae bacterium]